MFVINPEDVEREALAQGISRIELEVPSLVFLTFNQCILEEFSRVCKLRDWEWLGGRFSPAYSHFHKSWKGTIDPNDIGVFFPPMGASTLVSFCEELIFYGARVIFLLCASWGLGKEYLQEGQIHLPSFTVGMDGTSPHYGNEIGKLWLSQEHSRHLRRP